jgi:hypothetical protein
MSHQSASLFSCVCFLLQRELEDYSSSSSEYYYDDDADVDDYVYDDEEEEGAVRSLRWSIDSTVG